MKPLPALAVAVSISIASVASTSAQTPIAPEASNPNAVSNSSPDSFRLRNPTKEHLTASQLYQIRSDHKPMREFVGQFVLVNVVVEIAREQPLVDIELPVGLPSDTHLLRAHIVNISQLITTVNNGERFQIEGIIVNEGYGAYMIYLCNLQRVKSKGT